ncbi:MAG: hypothetical protein DRG78_08040, partial [Epsilonproteobacteria bacterium]
LYETINSFRPFGLENEMPSFIFRDVKVIDIKKMGKNKEFTKLTVSNQIANIEVIIFVDCPDIVAGENINFVATISKNEFRGNVSFNLMFKELIL